MRIVIDARMYGLENAGIGRYINNLIEQIEDLDKKNKYFILLREKYFPSLHFENKRLTKTPADYPHYSLTEQILLPLQLIKLKPDIVHFPHFNVPIFYRGKYVVTIHDLIKHTSRGMETTTRQPWFYWLKYLGYKIVFRQAVNRAAKILVPSQAVKKELMAAYNLSGDKIVVTYEGVDKEFQISNFTLRQAQAFSSEDSQARRGDAEQSRSIKFQISNEILKRYKIKKPFIIYTGNLYPHKNIERLLQAVICLNDSNHLNKPISLVIACARSVFYERLKKKIDQMKAEKFVNLVGFVPDEDLALLYKEAEAFVFPSLSEGFGLPGLEAMACGLPVICSDILVLREIYGDAALYFNPLDPQDMATKIELVLKDGEVKQKLKKLGPELAEGYSWQKMVKETLGVYRELGEKGGEKNAS